MEAIRIQAAPEDSLWSASSPPSSDNLELVQCARPAALHDGDLIIKVKATSVVRDNLTWPELFHETPAQIGNDFAGIVIESLSDDFKIGDEVFGMVAADRGGTWAQELLVKSDEACIKPKALSWKEAAALPLSALTADQALFTHGEIEKDVRKRILITGAAGAVGIYLIQFAIAAGQDVVAATSSASRDKQFLASLGIEESIEYDGIVSQSPFDLIVDTVGGEVLRSCWKCLKDGGKLISIDSNSWNFVEEHQRIGLSQGNATQNARFFIVEPSKASIRRVAHAVEQGGIKVMVSKEYPFHQFKDAYDAGNSRGLGKGRVILSISS